MSAKFIIAEIPTKKGSYFLELTGMTRKNYTGQSIMLYINKLRYVDALHVINIPMAN